MSSPNDIEVMLHYYALSGVHPRVDAPAVRDAIDRFMKAGLLIPTMTRDVFEATEGGRMYIELLCAVPFPVTRWVEGENFQK